MKNIDPLAPVGVFDSGVGGLTVAREIIRQLPNEKIVYFGDTARVPYGNKSKENVIKYSRQIIRFLMSKNVKAIVVACNTASAIALEEIRPEIDIPIIGVVKPGACSSLSLEKSSFSRASCMSVPSSAAGFVPERPRNAGQISL